MRASPIAMQKNGGKFGEARFIHGLGPERSLIGSLGRQLFTRLALIKGIGKALYSAQVPIQRPLEPVSKVPDRYLRLIKNT